MPPVAEEANAMMDAASIKKIEEAKAIVEAAGYKISPNPALWKSYECLVRFKIQSHHFSDKEMCNIVKNIVQPAFGSLEKFQKLTTRPVVAIGSLDFLEGNKVRARLVEDKA